ncbi:MAG: hypothetical protein ACLU4N_08575 [Butyricimonas faecihominis]
MEGCNGTSATTSDFPIPGLPQGTVYTDGYDRPSYFSSSTEVFISKDRDAVCWSGANGLIHSFHFKIVSIILKESMY